MNSVCLMLLRSKGLVGDDGEKSDVIRQRSDGSMSASEVPLTQPLLFKKASSMRKPEDRRHELNRCAEVWRLHRPRC
jgi:hypothetical protein